MATSKLILVSANRHTEPYPVYPLGISCLSSYLEINMPDLEVHVFDFMTRSFEDYTTLLEKTNPDYIGISLRNIDDVNIYKKESFINHYRKIISVTRENSKAVVIIGGSGFSIYPEILYSVLEPDFGIYGEGEESLRRLISDIENGNDPGDTEGLVFRRGSEITVNRRAGRLRSPVLSFDDSMADYYWQKSGMLNIQTKRGCPYRCIYCTYPLIEGRRVRTLDAGKVVAALSELYRRKKINYIFFTDSIFNISNEFNYRLADAMLKAELDISWGGYFNFTNIDRKLLERLKQAGLRHIEFGTDTISDTLLKKYRKPFSVDDILRISDYCHELRIDYAHFLILGGYGETDETLDETFKNSEKIAMSVFFPFIGMRIYPGTELHKIAVREKVVKENDDLLEPLYYVSKDIKIDSLRERAAMTGKAWIFPDDEYNDITVRLRSRGKKGPLWEYLVK